MKTKSTILGLLFCFAPLTIIYADLGSFTALDVHGNWAAEDFVRPNVTPRGWQRNTKRMEGSFTWVDANGGHVLEMRGDEGGANPFHLYTRDFFRIEEGATVKGTIEMRGEGELQVTVYAYDADENSLGITPEQKFNPASAGDFAKVNFEIVIPPFRKGAPTLGRLALSVPSGSRIQIASITTSVNVAQ